RGVPARRHEAARRTRRAEGAFVLVAPVLAAMQASAPTLGADAPLVLERDETIAQDDLAERLVALGYERTDVVEHRGEFAVRGGIVDVFPGTARRPVRIEFFGDEIESLREFAPSTQLSTDPVARIDVHPARDLIATEAIRARAEELFPKHKGRIAEGLGRLAEGLAFEGMESLTPLVADRLETP